mmetsp:Transcript_69601/g.148890  ORF Transcript_69601/g.148890 Transcript_69601/m.148890 type:complete len:116 (-) Transcript_69601:29-376(-)
MGNECSGNALPEMPSVCQMSVLDKDSYLACQDKKPRVQGQASKDATDLVVSRPDRAEPCDSNSRCVEITYRPCNLQDGIEDDDPYAGGARLPIQTKVTSRPTRWSRPRFTANTRF